MKGKLFVLIGESCSGKSTLERKIYDYELCRKIISLTTRKPRSNEINGVHYHFIDNLTFAIYKAQDQLLECTSYMMNKGNVSYGTLKYDVKLDEGNYVCVLNPDGYRQVIESLGKENVVGIYIKRDPKERFISYLNRENEDFNSLLKEAWTRYNKDLEDFVGIEDKVDYVIKNTGIEDMIIQFINILNVEMNKWRFI